MTENKVDVAVIKNTQDILGKFIKKPILTEKLLSKPPFRFIHDIISSIIKETGFLSGLFTKAELNSENMKDRDAKVKYLQKLIDVMKLISSSNIRARPSKIVAGQEADKTNELLQLIGMAIENKLDYKQAVEFVQAQNASDKMKSKSKERFRSNRTHLESKNKGTFKKENNKGETATKILSSKTAPIKSTNVDRMVSNTSSEAISKGTGNVGLKIFNEENTKIASNINIESNKIEEATSTKVIERIQSKDLIQDPVNERLKYHENEPNNEIPNENLIVESEKLVTTVSVAEEPDRAKEVTRSIARVEDECFAGPNNHSLNENQDKKQKNSSAGKINTNLDEISLSISERTRGYGQKMKEEFSMLKSTESISDGNQEVFKDKPSSHGAKVKRQSTFIREDSQHEVAGHQPRTSLRPPSVRPVSARPGAPRRRDKNVEVILHPNEQLKLSGINMKLDNFESQLEDDGETLVIVERSIREEPSKDENKVQMEAEGQQGRLVQQILQTQKELIQTDPKECMEYSQDFVVITFDKKHSSARQMDSLRDVIQSLTRSTNPLGKLLDFLPEDIDSMHLELNMWRNSYSLASSELKKEKSLTESALEPLKNQLEQIRMSIKEHKDISNRTCAKILRNSDQINKLLADQ